MVEAEAKQLLRRQQRHPGLFRRPVAFPLVAFYARRDQVLRGRFAALGTRKNVIERQILCMTMLAAVLAAIAVADIDPCTLHSRFAVVTLNVDIVTKPDHGGNRKNGRRRVENIVAIVFFDKNRAAKP